MSDSILRFKQCSTVFVNGVLTKGDDKASLDESIDDTIEEGQEILIDNLRELSREEKPLDSAVYELDPETEDGLHNISKSISRNSRRASLLVSRQPFSRKTCTGSIDVMNIPINEEEELKTIPQREAESISSLNTFQHDIRRVLSSVSDLHSSSSSVSIHQSQIEVAVSRNSSQASLSKQPSNSHIFKKKSSEPRTIVPLQFSELLDKKPKIIEASTSRITHWKPSDLNIVIV
jgi:hypothetical protein